MERKLQKAILFDTKRDVQLKHFIVLKVPKFQQVRKLISTFTLHKSTVYSNQSKFKSVNFVNKLLKILVFAMTQTGSAQRKTVSNIKNEVVTHFEGETDNESLKKIMEMCKNFLVDSEMEDGRQRNFNFTIEILDAHTLSQKLDATFEKHNCAAIFYVDFGFVLKNVEAGTSR